MCSCEAEAQIRIEAFCGSYKRRLCSFSLYLFRVLATTEALLIKFLGILHAEPTNQRADLSATVACVQLDVYSKPCLTKFCHYSEEGRQERQ